MGEALQILHYHAINHLPDMLRNRTSGLGLDSSDTGLWQVTPPICRPPDYFPYRDFGGVTDGVAKFANRRAGSVPR